MIPFSSSQSVNEKNSRKLATRRQTDNESILKGQIMATVWMRLMFCCEVNQYTIWNLNQFRLILYVTWNRTVVQTVKMFRRSQSCSNVVERPGG